MALVQLVLSLTCLCSLAVSHVNRPALVAKFAMDSVQKGSLQTYKYTNCGNSSYIANLTELTFSPDPLAFPGPLNVQFSVDIKEDVGTGLKGNVVMTKRIGSTWIKIPCIGLIGSCTYDDVCSLLDKITSCPDQFIAAGIPCKCPFPEKSYSLPKATFDVTSAVIPSGDYHFVAYLEYQGKPVVCADIYASFA